MTYLVILLLIALVLGFLFYGGRTAGEPARRQQSDDVDHDELEQAEREVQETDDEDSVRDWGPGTTKP